MRISDWSSYVCSSGVLRGFEGAGDRSEEAGRLALEQRIENHVLAAREGPVERGPGDAGGAGDVVGGGLGDPPTADAVDHRGEDRSEEHTSELQSLMRISYAVFCLKKQKISYE